MAAKKTNYISYELDWLEQKVKGLREYVDKRPFEDIQDRIETIETDRGGVVIKVIAREEDQIKSLRETIKEIAVMLADLNKLRKLADDKGEDVNARGGVDLPGVFKRKLLGNGRQNAEDEDDDD